MCLLSFRFTFAFGLFKMRDAHKKLNSAYVLHRYKASLTSVDEESDYFTVQMLQILGQITLVSEENLYSECRSLLIKSSLKHAATCGQLDF